MNSYVIIGALVMIIICSALAYREGAANKENEMITEQAEAIEKRNKTIRGLQADQAKAWEQFNAKTTNERRTANEKIRGLLKQNAQLKTWDETPVPDAAADFAWGVQ